MTQPVAAVRCGPRSTAQLTPKPNRMCVGTPLPPHCRAGQCSAERDGFAIIEMCSVVDLISAAASNGPNSADQSKTDRRPVGSIIVRGASNAIARPARSQSDRRRPNMSVRSALFKISNRISLQEGVSDTSLRSFLQALQQTGLTCHARLTTLRKWASVLSPVGPRFD